MENDSYEVKKSKGMEKVEHSVVMLGQSVQAKDRPLLLPLSAPEPRVLSLVFLGTVTSAHNHVRSNRQHSGCWNIPNIDLDRDPTHHLSARGALEHVQL